MKIQRKKINNQAVSVIEYVLLIGVVITAILFTQKYIVRAIAGKWKQAGDTFSLGQQYDPKKTLECAWSGEPNNLWYSQKCFDDKYDNDYHQAYQSCFGDCTGDHIHGWGSCPNPSSGSCWSSYTFQTYTGNAWVTNTAWRSNARCCDAACQKVCTDMVYNDSLSVCSSMSLGGVSCND